LGLKTKRKGLGLDRLKSQLGSAYGAINKDPCPLMNRIRLKQRRKGKRYSKKRTDSLQRRAWVKKTSNALKRRGYKDEGGRRDEREKNAGDAIDKGNEFQQNVGEKGGSGKREKGGCGGV